MQRLSRRGDRLAEHDCAEAVAGGCAAVGDYDKPSGEIERPVGVGGEPVAATVHRNGEIVGVGAALNAVDDTGEARQEFVVAVVEEHVYVSDIVFKRESGLRIVRLRPRAGARLH